MSETEYGDFSDISDCELLSASQLVEQIECSEIQDSELVEASENVEKLEHSAEHSERQFASPVSECELRVLQSSRFTKRTVKHSVWAVTLFGEWRVQRNRRCLEKPWEMLTYLDRYFATLTVLFDS